MRRWILIVMVFGGSCFTGDGILDVETREQYFDINECWRNKDTGSDVGYIVLYREPSGQTVDIVSKQCRIHLPSIIDNRFIVKIDGFQPKKEHSDFLGDEIAGNNRSHPPDIDDAVAVYRFEGRLHSLSSETGFRNDGYLGGVEFAGIYPIPEDPQEFIYKNQIALPE